MPQSDHTVYKEKSFTEKIKDFLGFKTKKKEETLGYEQINKQQTSRVNKQLWDIQVLQADELDPDDAEAFMASDLDVKKRKSFSEKRKERNDLDTREKNALESGLQRQETLEMLLRIMGRRHEFCSAWLEEIRSELDETIRIQQRYNPLLSKNQLRQSWSDMVQLNQKQLQKMYDKANDYYYEMPAEEITGPQLRLLKRIMFEVNGIQLLLERLVSIRKEREFLEEDESELEQAEDDHELDQLTPEERKALKAYSGSEIYYDNHAKYQLVNEIERGKYDIEKMPKNSLQRYEISSMLEMLRHILKRSQKKTKKLYRGTNLERVFGKQIANPQELVGTTFVDKGYMSTSREKVRAARFIRVYLPLNLVKKFVQIRCENLDAPPPDTIATGDMLMEIVARKGIHSIDMTEASDYPEEAEILLKPRTPMYIHSVEEHFEMVKLTPADFEWIARYVYPNKNLDLNRIYPPSWGNIEVKASIPILHIEAR